MDSPSVQESIKNDDTGPEYLLTVITCTRLTGTSTLVVFR